MECNLVYFIFNPMPHDPEHGGEWEVLDWALGIDLTTAISCVIEDLEFIEPEVAEWEGIDLAYHCNVAQRVYDSKPGDDLVFYNDLMKVEMRLL